MKLFRVIATLLLPAALLMAGCSGEEDKAASVQPSTMTALYFQEVEAGVDPYPVRVLVSPGFLRFDDGEEATGYVLFDRTSGNIYSVAHGERMIFVVLNRPVTIESPKPLELTQETLHDPDAPKIDGKTPTHYQLSTNGELCGDVVVVPGMLEEARLALVEYHQALAGEQAANLEKTPPEYRTDCMLSELIFAPARYLEHGFPIHQSGTDGYMRSLVNYEVDLAYQAALFELPADYGRYSVNPLEEGEEGAVVSE